MHRQTYMAHRPAALFVSLLCRNSSGLFIAARMLSQSHTADWLLLIEAHNNRTKTSKWVSLALYIQSDWKNALLPIVCLSFWSPFICSCVPSYRKQPVLCRLSNLLIWSWLPVVWQWLLGIRPHQEEVEITFVESAHVGGSATIQKDGKAKLKDKNIE